MIKFTNVINPIEVIPARTVVWNAAGKLRKDVKEKKIRHFLTV